MKKRFVAIILAVFAGFVGAHKFYLRQAEVGIGYIALFIWLGRFIGFPFSAFLGWYDALKLINMDPVEFDRKYNSYFFRDRYGRRLDWSKRKNQKRNGRYILIDEDPTNLNEQKESYLKPINRSGELEQLRKSGVKKFRDYDTKGAIDDFKKALEISPEDRSLNFNIACAYSIEENAYCAFYHLDKAVSNGFREFDKIMTHEALAYIRVMPQFEIFQKNNFRATDAMLNQLKDSKPEEPLILKQPISVILNSESK